MTSCRGRRPQLLGDLLIGPKHARSWFFITRGGRVNPSYVRTFRIVGVPHIATAPNFAESLPNWLGRLRNGFAKMTGLFLSFYF